MEGEREGVEVGGGAGGRSELSWGGKEGPEWKGRSEFEHTRKGASERSDRAGSAVVVALGDKTCRLLRVREA